jgi:23S rRNA (uracil1939-C5)-methyltransferase
MAEVSCVHADQCAGCPLIHLTYADQLVFKAQRLQVALAPYPELRPAIEPTLPAEPREAYRGRAKLMVSAASHEGGVLTPVLGLFARSVIDGNRTPSGADHRVVDIPGCRVLRPRLAQIASGLRTLLAAPPEGTGACLVPEAMGGKLSAVDLREVLGERPGALVTLVLRSAAAPREGAQRGGEKAEPSPPELERAAAAVRALSSEILGVAVNYRPDKSPQVLGNLTRVVSGVDHAADEAGTAFHIASYGSFVQAHRGQAHRIATLLSECLAEAKLGDAPRLLDLYGGSGALSLDLAKRGAHVALVESFRPAALAASRAAEEQGISRFAVHVGDAGRVLDGLARDKLRFDAIVTNPPRRGMAPEVRRAIAALGPRAIIYVSCDPDSLARDLAHFGHLGYATQRLWPVDMIPLTDQVETVAFLTPAPRPPLTVAYEDADLRVVEKPAHFTVDQKKGDDWKLIWTAPEDTSGFAVSFRHTLPKPEPRQECLVLARGVMAARGRIGKTATYTRLAKLNGHSLLHVILEQGNASDLRRDLAQRGHAVVGDRRRGHEPTNRHFEERYMLDRPFLHCVVLSLAHPCTRSTIQVRQALPGELGMVLTRLSPLALDVAKRVMVG